jgi:hypothetical protein
MEKQFKDEFGANVSQGYTPIPVSRKLHDLKVLPSPSRKKLSPDN